MSEKKLEIKTATISIKVVQVDGHKMTKATFRQIEGERRSRIKTENIIGWVLDKGCFNILLQENGTPKVYQTHGETEQMRKYIKAIKDNFDQLYIAT